MKSKKLVVVVGSSLGLLILLGGAGWVGYWAGRNHPASVAGTEAKSGPAVVGLSREQILQMLPDKTWYMHWENKNRGSPVEFTAIEGGKFHERVEGKTYVPELRWVLSDGIHLFVPLDATTIKGFFRPNGRPKGFFTDNIVKSPPPAVGSP